MTGVNEILLDFIESINTDRKEILPSDWAEAKRTLTSDVSTLTGRFRYSITPYLKEIINTLSPYHDAKIIAVMKGSQVGFTEGVVVNGILWMIANCPGNTMVLSADDQLSKEMVEQRLDQGIQSCGIQHLIRPNTIRKRNQRTGDTSKSKEFAGGRAYFGSLQSITKLSRQRSIRYGFFDDWEKAPLADKEQGNTFDLIQQRFATASKSMKQYYISTPEVRPSNIELAFLKGDQRIWTVPCPLCGDMIELIWHKVYDGQVTGVYFEKDDYGKLIDKSLGYVCQSCGRMFKEKNKYEINLHGAWQPQGEATQEGFYSYKISNLVAAPHMYNWTHYARKWLEIFEDGITKVSKLKVFLNQTLGEPWEERIEAVSGRKLMENCRGYEIGIVPNQLSIRDGNGNIVLLTCACDLNGTIDDARLDYEIWGHSESGSVYSIDHGSIGTYQPDKRFSEREVWSYKIEAKNNVWDYLWNEIINRKYTTDEGKEMPFVFTGIDTGYITQTANDFIDAHVGLVVGLKGDDPNKYTKMYADKMTFQREKMRHRTNFILSSNIIKDNLSLMVAIEWNRDNPQTAGFINFPQPVGVKYTERYFKEWESEKKILEENDNGEPVGWRWVKKTAHTPNHVWDTAYYNLALRDIFTSTFLAESGIKNGTWADYVRIIKNLMS